MCGTLLCTAIIGSEYIRLASHVPGSVVHVVMWHTGLCPALYCPSQCMCRCICMPVLCAHKFGCLQFTTSIFTVQRSASVWIASRCGE